jgi:hypothetical protein
VKLARGLVTAGAMLLVATAAVHSLGSSMVSGWLEGERRAILMLAWFALAIDWIVVASTWLYCAWRGGRSLAPVIYLTALIPAATAAGLVLAVGPGFFGIWMLAGAVALACAGASRLG